MRLFAMNRPAKKVMRHILDKLRSFELELLDYESIFEVLSDIEVEMILDYCYYHSDVPEEFQQIEKVVLMRRYSRRTKTGKEIRLKYGIDDKL